MSQPPDVVDLHVRLVARDPAALVDFEAWLRPLVIGYLRRRGVQDADADEIWNRAFFAVVERADNLRPLGHSLRPFTMKIVHNRRVDLARTAASRAEVALDAAAGLTPQSGASSLTENARADIERCLENARPTYRRVTEMVAQGLSTREVARILDKTEANAAKLRQRALAWFRRCLEGWTWTI